MKPSRIATTIFLLMTVLSVVNGILIGFVPNLLQDKLTGRETYFWIALVGINALIIGYSLRDWQYANTSTPDQSISEEQASRNRQAMLEKVRATWIVGVLNQSLYQTTLITLGLQARPDAVTRPMDVLIQRPHYNDRALPLDKPISQVYDDLNRTMLILGEPGAGKTTLLLELTHDLLDRATNDPAHPIPIVFPLSSWAEQRRPLADWLVDELHLRYDVPRSIAQPWIDANAILPLLDGLDEVAQEHRAACVEAINTFRQEKYGLLPLVVSSRIGDYDALTIKLRLDGAIVVQPLTREQVRDYLRQVGMTVTPSSSSPLWELFDSPFMLNIAIMTYAEPSGAGVHIHDLHQDQLFAAYVNRMFQHNSPQLRFSQRQTAHWLSWLAWQMRRQNQTVFYLEHMQLDWLPQRQRQVIGLLGGLGVALFVGSVGGLGVALFVGLVVGLRVGLLLGLIFGLLFWLGEGRLHKQAIDLTDTVRWSWTEMRVGLSAGLREGLANGLGAGPVFGLLFGLFFALREGLFIGLLSGLVVGLGGGLGAGLIRGVIFGLSFGLSRLAIEYRTRPNEGIRRSGQAALGVGLIFALSSGLVGGLLVWLSGGLVGGLRDGLRSALINGLPGALLGALVIGLVGGLTGGMRYGGAAWIHHYALRLLLVRQGVMPFRYVPFLDFAAQRILLRKVGGGYIFIHRLLLEYFAAQYTGPETVEVKTTSKGT